MVLEVSPNEERKMIESIVYTLTSIKGIDKIKIQVDSSPLTKLPNSKEQLPEELDKNYGVNKTYDLVTTNNIISYTTYYVNKYNNNEYYVPVTKYILFYCFLVLFLYYYLVKYKLLIKL